MEAASDAPPSGDSTPPVRGASDWETLVGGQWALWIGVLLILIATSFGIAYGWQHVSEAARVGLGVLLGLALLVGGELTRGRGAKWFDEGLTAGGVSLLYLSIWGAAMRYQLIGTLPAFAWITIVTALCVAVSVRRDAIGLMALGTIGGYLTPALLKGQGVGGSHADLFWLYVTILNGGILGAATFRQWRSMHLGAFCAATLLLAGWFATSYSPGLRWTVFSFLTINFLLFMAVGAVYPLRCRMKTELIDLVFIFGVAGAYFGAGAFVLPAEPEVARGGLALVLAAVCFGLGWVTRERMPEDEGLALTGFGLGAAFFAIAPPLLLGGHPVVMAWAAEAAALTIAGYRGKRPELLSIGLAVWGLSLIDLVWVDVQAPAAYGLLLLNPRGAMFVVVVAASALMSYIHLQLDRAHPEGSNGESARALAVAATAIVYWFVAREASAFFSEFWQGDHATRAAWFTILALWSIITCGLWSVSRRAFLALPDGLVLTVPIASAAVIALWGLGAATHYWAPLANPRLLGGLVVAACMVWLARRSATEAEEERVPTGDALAIATSLLIVALLSEELFAAFSRGRFPDALTWQLAAWFGVVVIWSLGAAANVVLGFRWSMSSLRWTGLLMAWLAWLVAIVIPQGHQVRDWLPLFNPRALAFVVLTATAWGLAVLYRTPPEELSGGEQDPRLPPALGVGAAFLGLWVLTAETFHLFAWSQFPAPQTWRYAAHLGVSVLWTLYAGAGLWWGMLRRHGLTRWLSLALFGLAVSKVFLWDLSFLTLPFRVVSFGVLGGILVGVARVYSRYGDELREWGVLEHDAGEREDRPEDAE